MALDSIPSLPTRKLVRSLNQFLTYDKQSQWQTSPNYFSHLRPNPKPGTTVYGLIDSLYLIFTTARPRLDCFATGRVYISLPSKSPERATPKRKVLFLLTSSRRHSGREDSCCSERSPRHLGEDVRRKISYSARSVDRRSM